MLSPNTLLNKARYRVDSLVHEGSAWALYHAEDQQTSDRVLLIERNGTTPVSSPITHDGILAITDTFTSNGRSYQVSEALAATFPSDPRALIDRFAVILMALNTLEADGNADCVISPDTVVPAKSGNLKLLPLESASTAPKIEDWYLPIDAVYEHLDYVSQRAIYNSWGEAAVASLERPAPTPSQIYSLAAIFYKLLTNVVPAGGFERTVTVLDGPDPLKPIAQVIPCGRDLDAFFARALALRPEDRFARFEEAILDMPTSHDLPQTVEHEVREDEADIIELAIPQGPHPTGAATTEVVETIATDTLLDKKPVLEWHPAVPQEHGAKPTEQSELGFVTNVESDTHDLSVETTDDAPLFSAELKPAGSSAKYFVAAGLVIAAVAVAAWFFILSGGNAVPAEAPVAALAAKPTAQDAPPASPAPEPATAEIPTTTAEIPGSTAVESGVRPQTAQLRPAAKSAEKPAPPPAKAKKKLTVDDLINDN